MAAKFGPAGTGDDFKAKGFKYMFLKVGPNKLCERHIMEIDRNRSCGIGEVKGSNKIL